LVINLQQLRALVAVIDSGSFTKAAVELYLTQPAVSMQVQRLQSVLGATLLQRDGRKLVPTDAGLAVYRYAHEVLSASETLQRDIEALSIRGLHHITVGTGAAYSAYLLPSLLAAFQRSNPSVRVTLVDGSPTDLIEQVRRAQMDIAIIRTRRIEDDLDAYLLGTDDVILIQSARMPVWDGPTLTLEQVIGLPFVRRATGRDTAAASLDEAIVGAGLPPLNTVLTFGTWEGVKEAVRAGSGLAIALRAVVQRELQCGELREVAVQGYRSEQPVYLLQSPRRRSGPRLPEFERLLTMLINEFPLDRESRDSTHGVEEAWRAMP